MMASVRYISVRSADDNPSRWNPAELRGPLLSDSSIGTGRFFTPVKNEQVMHVYKMHHVMAHLPVESFYDRKRGQNCGFQEVRKNLMNQKPFL